MTTLEGKSTCPPSRSIEDVRMTLRLRSNMVNVKLNFKNLQLDYQLWGKLINNKNRSNGLGKVSIKKIKK